MNLALLIPTHVAPFTLAQLDDDNAIKTAIATATSAASYSGAAINGALASGGTATMRMPQLVRVVTSSAAAQYVAGSTITFTGTLYGVSVTREIALTDADGGEDLTSTLPMSTVTQIDVEAQAATGGQFEFGVLDVCGTDRHPIVQVGCQADGDVDVTCIDGSRETLTGVEGQNFPCLLQYVHASATTPGPVNVWTGYNRTAQAEV